MSNESIKTRRNELQAQYGYVPCPAPDEHKVGISASVKTGALPIHGVRSKPTDDTTGWYIWAGDTMPEEPDAFLPLHAAHLVEWCPDVLPYLELPPGWRFLVAPGYSDVWFDPDVDTEPG